MMAARNTGRDAQEPSGERPRAKPAGLRSRLPQLDNAARVLVIALATAVLTVGGILVAHADTLQAASAKWHGDLIGYIVIVVAFILVAFSILCPGRFREQQPVAVAVDQVQTPGVSPVFKPSVDEFGNEIPAEDSAAQPIEHLGDG